MRKTVKQAQLLLQLHGPLHGLYHNVTSKLRREGGVAGKDFAIFVSYDLPPYYFVRLEAVDKNQLCCGQRKLSLHVIR